LRLGLEAWQNPTPIEKYSQELTINSTYALDNSYHMMMLTPYSTTIPDVIVQIFSGENL
jgi:hypothetical protein